jgi:glutamate synthase (NADPH/NADH) small chain
LGNEEGKVCGVRCLSYELGEPDASGRRSPVAIPGSEHDVECDAMIVALGNGSNPLLVATTPGLNADNKGHITVDEKQATSHAKVWAGGDIVLGAATVILAMGEGRKAAAAINEYLK